MSYDQFFAPQVYLSIEGQPAFDVLDDLISFEFTDHEKKLDELLITLNNKELKYQDDFRFARGVPIKVRWGYPGNTSDVRSMVLTEVRSSFPNSSLPVVTIRAFDTRKELGRNSNAKNWGAISSSDIARRIARRYRLGIKYIENANDARKQSRVQSADITDMQFLIALANKLNWDCYIEGGQLHFHPKKLAEANKLNFIWYVDARSTMQSLNAELNLKKYKRTGQTGTNTRTGGHTSDSADGGETGEEQAGSHWVKIDLATGAITPMLKPTPETDALVVKKHAKAQQGKLELRAVESEINIIGTPQIRARQMINVSGVGKAYSGSWRIKSARHQINFGAGGAPVYGVRCSLIRNALNTGTPETNNNKAKAGDKGAPQRDDNLLDIDLPTGGLKGFFSGR